MNDATKRPPARMLPTERISYSPIAGRAPLKLPDGKRMVVWCIVNVEEWDILSPMPRTVLTPPAGGAPSPDIPNWAWHEYGNRVGFWRIMRAFQERSLPLTVFGCALALERNPLAADAIKKSGFDVCCHGWRWVRHFQLTEAEEREHIAKAVTSLKQTVGEAPAGWYCRCRSAASSCPLQSSHKCGSCCAVAVAVVAAALAAASFSREAASSRAIQQRLYFLPLPQGQRSFRPILAISPTSVQKDGALVPSRAGRRQVP